MAMKKETLADYVRTHGQMKAAKDFGVSQGAISKALFVGREIYVKTFDDGRVEAEEVRPFPAYVRGSE
ncbi:Cro/CI family transcriptional regulator [Escherichia coli]|uniref:Cro/CI family transcriptional regulator n=1 Tax=Escherichia coli TaxID=562 RepID=UPI0030F41DC8